MHHPVKLLKLELTRLPDEDPTTRTKWLWKCNICGELFKCADVEVDHIEGHNPLGTEEQMTDFYENILNVTLDDLQVLCKTCHGIKTHVESHPGMTWDDAVKDKLVCKHKYLPVAKQKKELATFGYEGKAVSNQAKRTSIYIDLVDRGLLKE